MGHYDECRDGYCGICGQTLGNCEHTQKGFKQKLEWDYTPRAIKKEDLHHFLPDLAEKYGIKPILDSFEEEVTKELESQIIDMTKLTTTVANTSTVSYEEMVKALDNLENYPRVDKVSHVPNSQFIVLDCGTEKSAKKVFDILMKGLKK